ncbi:hypothetical protein V6N13_131199 [Hibiscus sabdariffa]
MGRSFNQKHSKQPHSNFIAVACRPEFKNGDIRLRIQAEQPGYQGSENSHQTLPAEIITLNRVAPITHKWVDKQPIRLHNSFAFDHGGKLNREETAAGWKQNLA